MTLSRRDFIQVATTIGASLNVTTHGRSGRWSRGWLAAPREIPFSSTNH